MSSVLKGKTVFVTGAGGFLGTVLCRQLRAKGASIVPNILIDLTDPHHGILLEPPDLVIHLAAYVGGLIPNGKLPYTFFEKNTMMTLGMLALMRRWGPSVPLVAAGSICAYPGTAPLPFNELQFWQGPPERSNRGYGLAKRVLAGVLECASLEFGLRYAHLISANLYGPHDHFADDNGHVIPALIRRIVEAKEKDLPEVTIWGTGQATRDFLYVEDAAAAYVLAAEHLLTAGFSIECNIGSGDEISIRRTAEIIANIVGYEGQFTFDTKRPDGQLRRRVDIDLAEKLLDWYPSTPIRDGLEDTIKWYRENKK